MALKRREVDFKRDFEVNFNGFRLFDHKRYVEDIKTLAGDEFPLMGKQEKLIGDGNSAAVNVLKRIVTGLVGYPITPSTPIAEGMAKAYADGFVNVFGERIFYFQPESELGAMAFLEGAASQGGRYADNTSSQGLTYKYKNMYSVAGKRLPVVMTMQTRELNKGGLSIHNGHADLYAARGAGWLQFMSANNQELHYLIPLAFKAIEQRQVMLPAIVAGEGFQKSHSIENINMLSDAFLKYFLGEPNRLFQPDFDHPVLMGTFTDIGVTMPTQMKQDLAILNAKKYVKAAMGVMNTLLGTSLDVVEDYYAAESEYVIVCLGAAAGTLKEAVDYYRSKGVSIGLLRPVLFYPVCTEELARGIQNAKVVTVMEKTALANERYLLRDVKHAAYNERTGKSFSPVITSGIYGLGSQDFSIEDCFAVIENMLAQQPRGVFGVGIKGPSILPRVAHQDYREKEVGITFIGVGAEGVKTAQETLAKVIVFGGDGAFYDIGNQGLNFALGENQDITWIIYNNEAYMNTGFQKSGASRFGSNRTTSPYGMELQGKEDFHRVIVNQAMAIPGVYVARLSLSNPLHAMRILAEAIAYKGPSLVEFFSPCPTGQGMKTDNLPIRLSRMMVESRAWTIMTRKPYARLDLSGNPDPENFYPRPRKIKGEEKQPTSFRDVVNLLGQFVGDRQTIDEIVRVNERQNLYLWCLYQYRAGLRDDVPAPEEIERLIEGR